MNSPRTTLYRDKANGKIGGVAAGIADYTGVAVAWIRLALFISIFVTSGASVPAYILATILLNKKPNHLYVDRDESRYWQGVRQNPKRTAREIRSQMRDVDRRLAKVEHFYVDGNPALSAEIEQLR